MLVLPRHASREISQPMRNFFYAMGTLAAAIYLWRVGFAPLVLIAAAVGLVKLIQWIRFQRRVRRSLAPGAGLARKEVSTQKHVD